MSRILPRFFRQQERAEDAAALAERLLESGEQAPAEQRPGQATLPGDARRLRGIPVVGGVSGTSPGTDPLAEVIAREPRRRVERRWPRNRPLARSGESGTFPPSPSRD